MAATWRGASSMFLRYSGIASVMAALARSRRKSTEHRQKASGIFQRQADYRRRTAKPAMTTTSSPTAAADRRDRAFARNLVSQPGACPRSLRDPDLSDGRDRPGGGLQPPLRRTDRALDRGLHCLRRVRAAVRLARRPLEPAQHDGDLFFRHRRVAASRSALAPNFTLLAIALFAVGMFAAIYHPVGMPMVIEHRGATAAARMAFNGVCGNIGVSVAAGITAALTAGSAGAGVLRAGRRCSSSPASPICDRRPTTAAAPASRADRAGRQLDRRS